MLFKREVFAKVGELDERGFLYYGDVGLCVRLTAAGYRALVGLARRAM